MSRRFGIPFCAALLGVAVLSAAPARAGFELQVSIQDITTGGGFSNTYSAAGNSNVLLQPSSSYTPVGATDPTVSLFGLQAIYTDSTSAKTASLKLSGTAAIFGTTDTYTITVTAIRTGYDTPPVSATGNGVLLSESQSGTFTATSGKNGDLQSFQSFLDPNNNGGATGFTPGLQSIPIPQTATTSGASTTSSTPISATDYNKVPYALTASFTLRITGNGGPADNPATDQFQASTTVTPNFGSTAVPEPGSVVLMLTGMPLPLVVLGMLRRRRASA